MKRLLIKNKVVRVYDSIDELPIVNFQKYNKYILIDSGIGSDVDDIDKHIVKIAKLMKQDTKKAMQELQNMRQNMFMVVNQVSPKYLAFAALIHDVDGKKVTDLSDENLKNILEDIQHVKHSWLVDFVMRFKKKVDTELEIYFPGNFTNPNEKEAYDKLKLRTMLVLEGLINEKDNAEDINAIDEFMLDLHKPKSFSGSTSIEVKYDKQFENACVLIAQKTSLNAREMTVLQFYNALDNIKQQAEKEQKRLRKR